MLHLYMALGVLFFVALIDQKTHRIPNKALGTAILCHALLWLFGARAGEFAVKPTMVLLVGTFVLLLYGRSRKTLETVIGMGDIKLILYTVLFASPYLSIPVWIIATALASLIAVALPLIARRPLKSIRVPFAPPFSLATLVAIAS